jgi:alkanesulfonate monooxygenase SsuD/methylene tetrahydromethanopterin reductase-like flavin-dependent oxidoreductase (luciferase family)
MELPPVRERLERLREAVSVMKEMWSGSAAYYRGKYYALDGAVCNPQPVQKPLPVWIGGSGERLLRVVSECADGWDTGLCTPEGYDRMAALLERHCEAVGRDVGEIERSYNCETVIIATLERELSLKKARLFEPMLRNKRSHAVAAIRQMPEAEYLARRAPFIGTPQQIIDQVGEFTARGVSNFVLNFPDLEKRESLQQFAEEVLPVFRAGP